MLKPFTYLNEGVHLIEDEVFVCDSNDVRVYLDHDNASSIKLYSAANKTGVDLTGNITIANDEIRPYRQYIKLDLQTRTNYSGQNLYLNYTATGEITDDMLLQELRDELVRLSNIIDNSSSTVPLSIQSTVPANGATNGSSTAQFTANKWLKKSQTNKFKCFPTLTDRTNGTNEVSSTVAMLSEDTYQWQATSSLSPSSTYYFKVLSGLQAIDGTVLESDYLFSYTTASNQAPTLSVSVTGNITLGSQLTASTTIGSDPEGDTVQSTTWRWLRSGVAISGATSSTYTLVEADLGKSITAEATVTMTTGSSPTPTQSNAISVPVPNPPSISVTSSSGQNTISFTQNSTLSTETYDLYWSTTQTTASGIKSSGTKISNITSPRVHSSLTNGTQYNYVLVMVVNGVESSPSGVSSGTPATNASPTVSVGVSGTTTIGSTLTASATIGSDPEGDSVSSTTWAWLRNDVIISGATASTYTIAEADIGTTLKARATVDMTTGSDPAPATSSGTAIPVPNPPSILVTAGNTQNTISFTQNSSFSTETYNLYWSTTTGVNKTNGTKITGVTSPYNHTGRTNGTAYYYVLTMVVNGVESADSAQVSGTPQTNTTPSVPTGLASSNITTSGFTLTWNASTDAEGNPITYNVYKGGVLYQGGVTGTSLPITSQTAGSTATWTVSASDGSLESNQSAGLLVTIASASNITTLPYTNTFTGADGTVPTDFSKLTGEGLTGSVNAIMSNKYQCKIVSDGSTWRTQGIQANLALDMTKNLVLKIVVPTTLTGNGTFFFRVQKKNTTALGYIAGEGFGVGITSTTLHQQYIDTAGAFQNIQVTGSPANGITYELRWFADTKNFEIYRGATNIGNTATVKAFTNNEGYVYLGVTSPSTNALVEFDDLNIM